MKINQTDSNFHKIFRETQLNQIKLKDSEMNLTKGLMITSLVKNINITRMEAKIPQELEVQNPKLFNKAGINMDMIRQPINIHH